MVATVLHTPFAIQASLFVVRAFVQLRRMLTGHRELAQEVRAIDARLVAMETQSAHDRAQMKEIREPIGKILSLLLAPPPSTKERIGFQPAKKHN